MQEGGLLANIADVKYLHGNITCQFLSLKDMLKLMFIICSSNTRKNSSWYINMLNETLGLCFPIIFGANAPRYHRKPYTSPQKEFLNGYYTAGFFKFSQGDKTIEDQQWNALKVYDSVGDNALILLDALSQQQKKIQIADIAPENQIKPLARSIYQIVLAPKQTTSIVVSLSPLLEMFSDENKCLDALQTLTVLLHKLDITEIEAQYHDVILLFLAKLRKIKDPGWNKCVTQALDAMFIKLKTTENKLWFVGQLISMLKDLNRRMRFSVLIAFEKWMPQLNTLELQFVIDHLSRIFDEDDSEFFCSILVGLFDGFHKKNLGRLLVAQLKPTINQKVTRHLLNKLIDAEVGDEYSQTRNIIIASIHQLDAILLLRWITTVLAPFNDLTPPAHLTESRLRALRMMALDMIKELVQTVQTNDLLQSIAKLLFTLIEMPQSWIAQEDLSIICQLIDRFEPTDTQKYTDRILALLKDPVLEPNSFVSLSVVTMVTGLIFKLGMAEALSLINRLFINLDPDPDSDLYSDKIIIRKHVSDFLERWTVTVKATDIPLLIEHILAMLNDSRPSVRYYALYMLKTVIQQSEIIPKSIWLSTPLLLKKLDERVGGVRSYPALHVFLALIDKLEDTALQEYLLFILDNIEDGVKKADEHLFDVLDSIIARRPQLSATEVQLVSTFLLKQLKIRSWYYTSDLKHLEKWLPKLGITSFPAMADFLLDLVNYANCSAVLSVIKAWIPTLSAAETQRLNGILVSIISSPRLDSSVFDKTLDIICRLVELNRSDIPLLITTNFVLNQLACHEITSTIESAVQATLFLLMSKLEVTDRIALMASRLERLPQHKDALSATRGLIPFIGKEITPWITTLITLVKHNNTRDHKKVLDVIDLFIPNMTEKNAQFVVTELMHHLNQENSTLRKNDMFNTIKAIVSYHPQYAHQLNHVGESLEKFYITLMLDMVVKALPVPNEQSDSDQPEQPEQPEQPSILSI